MADYRLLEIDYTVAPVANDIPVFDGTDWAPAAVSTILDADLNAIAALAGTDGVLCKTAANTWALRGLTAPAAGFTITNPRGIAGDPTFVLADDLAALELLDATAGLLVKTGANAYSRRTLQAPAAGMTITNPAGTAGDPTFVLANDLAALEALSSTGIACRTTTDTWAQRSLAAPAAGFTITNPAGVAGNPTFVLADDLAALEALATTGFADRTGASTWATRTLTGTTNQISITNGGGGGNPVFSTPQDIHTGATPTFDQLILGNAGAVVKNSALTSTLSVRGGSNSSGAGVDFYGASHASAGRLDLYSGSSAGAIHIQTRSAQPINFLINTAAAWSFASDGDLDPSADDTRSIGSASNRCARICTKNIDSGNVNLTIEQTGTDQFTFDTNGDANCLLGHITVQTAGKGLKIKEGSNAKMGQAVLVAGTKTVSTTAVTASSRIQLTRGITGGTVGHLSVGTITAGTSFVINSTSATETSTINWLIIEPS